MYIRGCLGCVIVCDTTQEKTMKSMIDWKKVVLENADYLGEDYQIPFIVLENKVDLLKSQDIPAENLAEILKKKKSRLEEFATANGFDEAFLTSAKENTNLEEAFMSLSEKILVQLEGKAKKEKDSNFGNSKIVLESMEKKEKKCC